LIKIPTKKGIQKYSPLENYSHFINYLKFIADEHSDKPVEKIVISIPSNFTHHQIILTKEVTSKASLQTLSIINETIISAII
jgi:molecular chaperone DnaK (HSP70)